MKNSTASHSKCDTYLIFRFETDLSDQLRAILYFVFLAYCFVGLSAITDRFFLSMENVVKHSRKVVVVDPETRVHTVRYEKVWNYAIADVALLAFGTSFPQISLATIDAIRNIGELYAGGLGPGTLVGSAAFDLFPIHAVCVIVPKAGELKKISDIGVWLVELLWSFWAYIWLYIILKVWTPDVITLWESLLTVLQYGLLLLHAYAQDKRIPYISLPFARSDRPLEWVPELPSSRTKLIEDFSDLSQGADLEVDDADWIHSGEVTGDAYHPLPVNEDYSSAESTRGRLCGKNVNFLSLWKEQFVDALMFRSHKLDNIIVRWIRAFWHLLLLPWRVLFAFVPPCHVAHGWIAFVSSLCFITGIAYVVTKLSDMISCVTGINPYVIAFTVLAAGTSWPDLWASKIAAERQITADSAIANITCSNSVNIYVGIGVPWLINTAYNFFAYREPLRIQDAGGLSFSLLVFFVTSACCIAVLVVRRLVFGAELGGPRVWAWATSGYFMLLWLVFVTLSSLKVSGFL